MLRRGAQSPKQQRVRLDRLLSNLGYTTRQQAKYFIHKHHVTLHGSRVLSLKGKVVPSHLRIDGQPVDNKPLNLVVHKPTGYVCTREKGQESKIIYDMLPENFIKRKPILSVAGRLDKWVTGLVLMSQNGNLVKRIITPKQKTWGKEFHPFSGEESQIFSSGQLMLKGESKPCHPAKFEILDNENKVAKITLYEGRYHQVRRMLAATGNKAIDIHRARVGPIPLGDLPVGKWRYMTDKEVKDIQEGRGDKVDSLFTKLDKLKASQSVEGALARAKEVSKERGEEEEIDKEERDLHAADEEAESREFEKRAKGASMFENEGENEDADMEEEGEEGELEDEGEYEDEEEIEGEEGEEGEEREKREEEEDEEEGELTEADENRLMELYDSPLGFDSWGPRGKLARPKHSKQNDIEPIDTNLIIKPKYDVNQLRAQAAEREKEKEMEKEKEAEKIVETKKEAEKEEKKETVEVTKEPKEIKVKDKKTKVEKEKPKKEAKEDKKSKVEKTKKEKPEKEKPEKEKPEKEKPEKEKPEKEKPEKEKPEKEKPEKETKGAKIKTITQRKREERLTKAAEKAELKKQATKKTESKLTTKQEKAKEEKKSNKEKEPKEPATKQTKTTSKKEETKKDEKENIKPKQEKDIVETKNADKKEESKKVQETTERKKKKSGVRSLHEMAGEYDDGEDESTFRKKIEKVFGKSTATPTKQNINVVEFEEEIERDEYVGEDQMAELRELFGLPRDLSQAKQFVKKKAAVSKKQQKIKRRK